MWMPVTDQEVEQARQHLVAWLRWHMGPTDEFGTPRLNQQELAERLGVSKGTISHWFRGRAGHSGRKQLPGMEALLAISKELRVSLDVLLSRSPPVTK